MSPAVPDSTRILRLATWIWIGFLLAMLAMDVVLYTPQVQQALGQTAPFVQQLAPGGQNPPSNLLQRGPQRIFPYFLPLRNQPSRGIHLPVIHLLGSDLKQLGKLYYLTLLLMISATPILINVVVVPRFPPGPLANAEGMALRQLPVLFVALALVAWEYRMSNT